MSRLDVIRQFRDGFERRRIKGFTYSLLLTILPDSATVA